MTAPVPDDDTGAVFIWENTKINTQNNVGIRLLSTFWIGKDVLIRKCSRYNIYKMRRSGRRIVFFPVSGRHSCQLLKNAGKIPCVMIAHKICHFLDAVS